MTRDTDSPPPAEICDWCSTRRTVSAWSRWSRILIPILLTLAVAGLGAASTSLIRDATTRATVETLDERRLEAVEDRRRLEAHQVETDRELVRTRLEVAEQLRQITTSLARIEARLDAREARGRDR